VALLRLAWDTRRDRREGEVAFRRVFERGLAGESLPAAHGNLCWRSRGAAIALHGIRRTTTIVFAPTAALAQKLVALRGRREDQLGR
jgi:hypothetical protein